MLSMRYATKPLDGTTLRWVRRSRAGWRWIDGVDAPLGEEAEAYRVTISGAGGTRVVECAKPEIALTAAERIGGAMVSVRQTGLFGESGAAHVMVPGSGETA